jgi:hypothetical protein
MKTKLHDPFVIETDFKADINFFQDYLDKVEWTDTNKLYGEHEEYNEAMYGRKMVHHYIQHISDYDLKLKKFIVKLFKDFGVHSKDWRADFFLTKSGGSMPQHIDIKRNVAFLLPLSKNTGPLVCENDLDRLELTYQSLIILNTKQLHAVNSPSEDRLLFRVALHDVMFEDLGIYKNLRCR